MSLRNSLTRHNYPPSGFQQISEAHDGGDAAVSIPMEPVRSASAKTSGSRRAGDRSPGLSHPSYDEKHGVAAPGHLKRAHETSATELEEALTTMGKVYDKIKNFSIITRYLLYVIPVGIILAIPIIVTGTPIPHVTLQGDMGSDWVRWGGVRIIWIWVWVEVFWVSLWGAKLFAKATPSIFQFLCGIVSPGVRKYKTVLKRLEIPLSLVIWFLVGMVTFTALMIIDAENDGQKTTNPSDIGWVVTFQHVLLSFLVSSLVYFGEQTIIQLISISYHHTQYDAKIKQSKHNIDTLTVLYDASIGLFPAYCEEFAEEDYHINDSLELSPGAAGMANRGRPKSGHVTPMRFIQNIGRVGDKVTAVFGNIASEVTGKQVFNPMASHSIIVEALEKKRSCEALARRIWMSLVVEGREALYLDDVQEVLAGNLHAKPEEVFASLDKDGNGDVSLDEMIMTVVEIGRERKSIATSLHDVDQAIKVLDRLLLFIVLLICIFVFVLILSPNVYGSLAGVGTSLLSLSFVFAVTTQEILGSCIFLFVKHPYDVGDRVDISGQQLIVERISLLYTIFKNVQTGKLTQSPNIVLNTLWVDNVSRSQAMKEQLLVYIDFTTSLEEIQLLRDEMQKFVLDKDNARDFQSDILVEVTGIANMDKMELKVEIRHKSNWHNETLRAARRSKFMCALVLALRKIPINPPGGADAVLGTADKPSWSVAISPDAAKAARQAFQDAAAAKKMINKKPQNLDGGSSSGVNPNYLSPESQVRNRNGGNGIAANGGGLNLASASEATALANLNMRSPTFDGGHDLLLPSPDLMGAAASRPAVENSKSPVRADSGRMRDLHGVYDTLQKSPSVGQRGKRRESYQLNVTAASPIMKGPQITERDILTPSPDTSPQEETFSGAAGSGARRRSGSPSGQAYSPLGRETFDDNIFNHGGWAAGNFAEASTAGQVGNPYKPYTAVAPRQTPPAPAAGRYAPPPPSIPPPAARSAALAMSATAGPQSPGESWFQRDSDMFDDSDEVMRSAVSPESPNHGPPSARASSVALGSLVGSQPSPQIPKEPMPTTPSAFMPKQATVAPRKEVARNTSTKSDVSWGQGDDGAAERERAARRN